MHWLILLSIIILVILSICFSVWKISGGGQNKYRPRPFESIPERIKREVFSGEEYGEGYEDEYEDEYDDEYDEYEDDPYENEEDRRWKLQIEDLETEEVYEFIFYDGIGIGRKEETEEYEGFLEVPDPRVSKLHCAIVSRGNALFLQDEGSSNHTFLNGKQITRPMEIQAEDVIGIGGSKLEIVKVFREV